LEQASAFLVQESVVEAALLRRFSAVVVEDSSTISLPATLAQQWQGCGGSEGSGRAALKVFVRWDVGSGRLEGPSLTAGRHSDKRSPFAVEQLPAGCLYLADLGFYSGGRLARLQGQGRAKRYFVSRYQPHTRLFDRQGKRLKLVDLVPQQVGQRVETLAVLAQEQLVVRVLIERVPAEVAELRRKRLREAAQDQGREPEAETLWLADWTIVLTNAPARLLSAEEVLVMMRLRWQIEWLLRLWKEHGHRDEWRSLDPWRILCELYAKLTAMVIQQWLITAGCWHDPHRSLVKAAQVVRREAGRLMMALSEGDLERVIGSILQCMQSGCRLNTRRTFPNTSQFVMGTALVWPKRRVATRKKRPVGEHRWAAGKGWQSAKIRDRPLS
jgi:Transposase DDE domain